MANITKTPFLFAYHLHIRVLIIKKKKIPLEGIITKAFCLQITSGFSIVALG